MTRSIFIGPIDMPVTGQSHAFSLLFRELGGSNIFLHYPVYSGNVFKYLIALLVFCYCYIKHVFSTKNMVTSVYLSCSRTKIGFFRDSVVIILAKFAKKKVICHIHGADFPKFRLDMGVLIRGVDAVYDRLDGIIILSEGMVNQFSMYRAEKIVISNFSSIFPAQPMYRSGSRIPKELSVLYLSNIMFSKGIFYLIDAIDSLVVAGHSVRLTVAGVVLGDQFMDKESVKRRFLEKISGKDYIDFIGFVGDDKDLVLMRHDVFVLPSFYPTEAQPISIIEAMSFGLPIITTRFNFLEELVSEESGELVAIRDSYQIELALLRLLDNSVFGRCSMFNTDKAYDEFTVEQHIKKIQLAMNT